MRRDGFWTYRTHRTFRTYRTYTTYTSYRSYLPNSCTLFRMRSAGIRTFLILWFGQVVSVLGSGLTGFAISIWVYQHTGSVTKFSITMLAATLPSIVFGPFAGALVDRWDRRKALIIADLGAGIGALALAVLVYFNLLQVWHIYIISAVSASFSSLHWPAFNAVTTLLVPQEHHARASGMMSVAEAVSMIAAPALGAFLLVASGLTGIIVIDFATFLFAVGTAVAVRVPPPPPSEEGVAAKGSLAGEALFGWKFIRVRPGLLGLLCFFAACNFFLGLLMAVFTPMMLTLNKDPRILGSIVSAAGVGLLIGTVVMGAWGGPKRKINGLVGGSVIGYLGFLAYGLPPTWWVLTTPMIVLCFLEPICYGCSQAIWMAKTPPDVQGRVFAVRRVIAQSMTPLSYLFAGPLVDRVLEPAFRPGGALASSVGSLIGTYPGSGMRFLLMMIGVVCVALCVAVYLYPRTRHVEEELPDFVPDARAEEPGMAPSVLLPASDI